jgi:5-hydroxyisourate hydrolase/2-oxo-4-hydroxy-4-carboxy-5-ureidoimidazoline decarboxylase
MISTHVLDTSTGKPAAGIVITLSSIDGDIATQIAHATTNADGRTDVPLADDLTPGIYELTFAVAPYFARYDVPAFYDTIAVRFHIAHGTGKYHVPLLLSPWGYSTYRGS